MEKQLFNSIICKRITDLRIEHNFTKEKLAYESGISKGGLSEIEKNMKEPRLSTIAKLCSCLGIKIKDFFDFEEIDNFVNLL